MAKAKKKVSVPVIAPYSGWNGSLYEGPHSSPAFKDPLKVELRGARPARMDLRFPNSHPPEFHESGTYFAKEDEYLFGKEREIARGEAESERLYAEDALIREVEASRNGVTREQLIDEEVAERDVFQSQLRDSIERQHSVPPVEVPTRQSDDFSVLREPGQDIAGTAATTAQRALIILRGGRRRRKAELRSLDRIAA